MAEGEGSIKLFGRTIQVAREEGDDKFQMVCTAKKAMDPQEENGAASTRPPEPSSQGKAPSRPDKNLPCPRCRSLDTKFCYYNNYNAKQPRHFCKNCQRYWTAGGTMRNVPVGAGRRKSKSLVSRAAITEAVLQTIRSDVGTGTVLSFSYHAPDAQSTGCSGDEYSYGSSVNGSNTMEEGAVVQNCTMYPCFGSKSFPARPCWDCSLPGAWNGHRLASLPPHLLSPLPPPRIGSLEFAPNPSPGKRSSIGDLKERCGSMQKMLQIDNPIRAKKSSICSIGGGGLMRAFQLKKEIRCQAMFGNSHVVNSNPAALSRSLNFQEIVWR